MKLEGKVVLVTGAAKRVGRAIATALAARGARIAIHYHRSRGEALRLARELRALGGPAPLTFRADLGKASEAARLPGQVAGKMGRLDALINNASIYERTPLGGVSESDWDRHLSANLRAPFFLAQAAAPHMRKAGAGHVVNIADWAAHRPYPDYTPYCVSKAGLLCLNKALAKGLAPKIQVNAVLPGPVLLPEDFTSKQRRAVEAATLLGRIGSPADIAAAVLFLLERGDFITGAELAVDGGRLVA